MGLAEILASIDHEILTLQKARALLGGIAAKKGKKGESGEAVSTVKAATGKTAAKRKKRKLSPEGRKRIAEAQKRRWDALRKAAAGSR